MFGQDCKRKFGAYSSNALASSSLMKSSVTGISAYTLSYVVA
jgi:hypothetical protein